MQNISLLMYNSNHLVYQHGLQRAKQSATWGLFHIQHKGILFFPINADFCLEHCIDLSISEAC